MHTEMWLNPATVANVEVLRSRGYHILEPASGRLTGNDSGIGRLPEPEEIFSAAMALVGSRKLLGKRIMVTAGGTHEPIDPVRFIGNSSSGKQGIAIAKAAALQGAEVTLIGANIDETSGHNINFVRVNTAVELESAVNERLKTSDALIQSAAVSDYRVAIPESKKMKRSVLGEKVSIELVANPDILAGAVSRIRNENFDCLTVGFAAETAPNLSDLRSLAASKLMSKGCDIIVANDVSGGKVFGSEENSVIILTKSGVEIEASGSKGEIAAAILDILFE
jgi:phosphopantothenoylcysteine decarboxylase/phosphopantothenate--cysteine ligase